MAKVLKIIEKIVSCEKTRLKVFGECPTCKTSLSKGIFEVMNYCNICGEKLDWEDDDWQENLKYQAEKQQQEDLL